MASTHTGTHTDEGGPQVASTEPGAANGLEAELEALRLERDEQIAAHQRTAADFANFRRRTAEEREREAGLAAEGLLMKILAISDDLDRAMASLPSEGASASWTEGIAAIHRKLHALLESEEVRPYESIGAIFDPREHEAVAQRSGSGKPAGEVLEEHRKGWRIRDRVLRPAVVIVAAD